MMKVRGKVFGAVVVGALAAALSVVGGGVAHGDPNTCTIQTSGGYYLTAVGGGGRTTDVIHTNARSVGSWEKFTLVYSGDRSYYGLKTVFGYYVTAVNGGGLTTSATPDVLHSNASNLLSWEKFALVYQNDSTPTQPGTYGIQTIDGHYLTARDAGGRTTNTMNSNESTVRSWEKYRINCGV